MAGTASGAGRRLLTATSRDRQDRPLRVLNTEPSARRLSNHVARALRAEAVTIATRWRAQGGAVAPGAPVQAMGATDGSGVIGAIDAIARGLQGESCWQDDLVLAGWELGTVEFKLGASLHAVLKQIDLLEAMMLYVVETATLSIEGEPATAAEGLALVRRMQRARSLLSLAAVKGFTEEYLSDVRARYRSLRHDLRNPLGTIRTAVSLMEDESIPADMRANPRFRTMVKRNASSIDIMIGRRLGDDTTHEEAFAWHNVSLVAVAWAVKRDLREDAAEAECEIIADASLPTVRMDAMGAELVLRTVVAALLREAARGSQIVIGPARVGQRSIVVPVRHVAVGPRSTACQAGLALADQLARRISGCVTGEGVIDIELPISVAEQGDDLAAARESAH